MGKERNRQVKQLVQCHTKLMPGIQTESRFPTVSLATSAEIRRMGMSPYSANLGKWSKCCGKLLVEWLFYAVLFANLPAAWSSKNILQTPLLLLYIYFLPSCLGVDEGFPSPWLEMLNADQIKLEATTWKSRHTYTRTPSWYGGDDI